MSIIVDLRSVGTHYRVCTFRTACLLMCVWMQVRILVEEILF